MDTHLSKAPMAYGSTTQDQQFLPCESTTLEIRAKSARKIPACHTKTLPACIASMEQACLQPENSVCQGTRHLHLSQCKKPVPHPSIIGMFLYYARDIDGIALPTFNNIGTQQSKPTKNTIKDMAWLMNYFHTYPNL
eukprot:10428506-Ditylum_brightwellii.AAC.1